MLRGTDSAGTLCIFARPPLPGTTKTRLIPAVGAKAAAELARAFLLDTCSMAGAVDVGRVVLCAAEPGPLPKVPVFDVWQQGPGDLGARMERMARRALERDPSWVVIIGSDSPGLPADFVTQATDLLTAGAEAVVGPAEDGGYYLLGLRRCPQALLHGIDWTRQDTLNQTQARLLAHELRPRRLPYWFDVDLPRDLARLSRLLAIHPQRAPHSRAALEHLDLYTQAGRHSR